jgi:putative endonuclease
MSHQGVHNYFVYVLTNINKQVLYVGVTNDLRKRLEEHLQDSLTTKKHFTGRYNCVHLVYMERFQWIEQAIEREKEIKAWRRAKKDRLITSYNPDWRFLNDDIW